MPDCNNVVKEFTIEKFYFTKNDKNYNSFFYSSSSCCASSGWPLVFRIFYFFSFLGLSVLHGFHYKDHWISWLSETTTWILILFLFTQLYWLILHILIYFQFNIYGRNIIESFLWFLQLISYNAVATSSLMNISHYVSIINSTSSREFTGRDSIGLIIQIAYFILLLLDFLCTPIPVRVAHTIYCFLFLLLDLTIFLIFGSSTTSTTTKFLPISPNSIVLVDRSDEIGILMQYFVMGMVIILVQCIFFTLISAFGTISEIADSPYSNLSTSKDNFTPSAPPLIH